MAKRRRKRKALPLARRNSHFEYEKIVIHYRTLWILIGGVVAVLLTMIFVGGTTFWIIVAVIILLTILMLVVNGSTADLPGILRVIGRILGL